MIMIRCLLLPLVSLQALLEPFWSMVGGTSEREDHHRLFSSRGSNTEKKRCRQLRAPARQ
jgi:hypothetical protein